MPGMIAKGKAWKAKGRKFLKKCKSRLKKCFIIKYMANGKFTLHVQFPFQLPARPLYALRYTARWPINPRKIVFDNYMGKGYGCNTKYVAEKLLEKYPGKFEVVWIVSKADRARSEIPSWIRRVDYASPTALWEYATAKVWVSNYHKISFAKRGVFKRKGQYFLQMWHGSLGIKKIEGDVSCLTNDKLWVKYARSSSQMVDFWISDSDFESDIYQRAFWGANPDNILLFGHPRNDVLLGDTSAAAEKVRARYQIENKKILFYAPTFREDYRLDCYRIDFIKLKQVLQQRFGGEWAILIRLHPRIRKKARKVIPADPDIYNATYYTDIQELIAAADCMITDYSSCVFDFMLTRRPAFLFAVDIEDFNTERGFYYPLETTPFPIAQNNQELFRKIADFDDAAYRKEVEAFLQEKGCIEDGQASERVVEKIVELTGEVAFRETKVRQGKTSEVVMRALYDMSHAQPLEDHKIVCVNFHGRGYGCNPKYIVEKLLQRRADLDIVWLTDTAAENNSNFPDGVRTVPYHSEQAVREMGTAKVLIDNTMKFKGFKKREGQYFIQTWHSGVSLGKIGFENFTNWGNGAYTKRVHMNFDNTDFVLTNSAFSTEVFRRAFDYNGAILEAGCPRNELVLDPPDGLREEICSRYQIPPEKKMLLYAPLYRGPKKKNVYIMDFAAVQAGLGEGYALLAFLHPKQQKLLAGKETAVNVSDYPDIQALLAVSDGLITDYADNMIEYALTGRSVYMFAPDYDDYRRKRDFYFEPEELPFTLSRTEEELIAVILSEEEDELRRRQQRFGRKIGLHETGKAAQYTAALVEKIIDGNCDLIQELALLEDGSCLVRPVESEIMEE